MNWLEVTIETSKLGIETVTGILLQLGITGFVIQDPDDFKEFLKGQGTQWDYMDDEVEKLRDCETSVTIYLADNAQGNETYIALKNEIQQLRISDSSHIYGSLIIKLGNVNEEDWANNWKQYFKPFEVGEKFIIKPSWEEYHTKTDRMVLEIDPNSSFGTGQHYTTQLCIEQLEKVINNKSHVLDVGCGSGILSIAALLLGAKDVTAVDIDQNSVEIAEENFRKNCISENSYKTYCGNILDDEELTAEIGARRYDVIVANIVANVILLMKDYFKQFLKADGILIASGIIGERADEVTEALKSADFVINEITNKNDWVAITAQLRN